MVSTIRQKKSIQNMDEKEYLINVLLYYINYRFDKKIIHSYIENFQNETRFNKSTLSIKIWI